jgi:hypothetical protein
MGSWHRLDANTLRHKPPLQLDVAIIFLQKLKLALVTLFFPAADSRQTDTEQIGNNVKHNKSATT